MQQSLLGQIPPPTPSAAPGAQSFASSPQLTSTTAPGKFFASRSELQEHYKSDWHRYNLKRREAGLPMLNEKDFQYRLEAAVALRKEREGRQERTGVDHLGKVAKSNAKKELKKEMKKAQKVEGKGNRGKPKVATKRENVVTTEEEADAVGEHNSNEDINSNVEDDIEIEDEDGELPEIDPCQSLFDNQTSSTLEENIEYMRQTYSFFIPDVEFIADLEGLIGYCSEKIRLGRTCLYCQKMFTSHEGCMKHMRDKRHCKILYERGVDQEEFDVFFDFSKVNEEFLSSGRKGKKKVSPVENDEDAVMNDGEEGDDGEWEDVSDDGKDEMEEDNDEGDDDIYAAYQEEIATHGFDITPLGELIFPDGRIVGHRGLARYYKQRFAPDRMERAAVRAAKEAAGDRLYAGRVVNLYQLRNGGESDTSGGGTSNSTALATMGRMSGSIPTGRNGNGILVPAGGSGSNGKGGYTALSLYRYRAAVKKQRREDDKGRRLQYRSNMNMNKLNKKGNNIMTGVIMTHQPR
ncbi:hypothetical protein ACHAXS_014004 [Conticribra weissflogii]